MLNVSNPGTPLPAKPDNIPVEQLYIKQAIGFALWNGERGAAAKLYLIFMERDDRPAGVVRFLGGTAVPPPYSMVSPMLQSLLRAQSYFGLPLSEECARDYLPLHIYSAAKVKMFANVGQLASQHDHSNDRPISHEAPDIEIHGLLPASPEFLLQYASHLDEVFLEGDNVRSRSGRWFNNAGIAVLVKHMLQQVTGTETMQILTEMNPAWAQNDDYTAVPG